MLQRSLMPQPEHQKFFEMFFHAHVCFASSAIAELGIADLIPRGVSRPVSELAKESGANADHLYRTLRLLASYGIFTETTPGTFALTSYAEVLRKDAPETMAPAWRMFHRLFKAQSGLGEALRTGGTPLEIAFGAPLFSYLSTHPEDAAIFDAGMTAIHGPETQAMLDAYDFSSIGTLADIGGGNGSLITAVLQKHPNLKGLLFDLGHVIGRARANVENAGLKDRCRIEEGNFFESIPAGADAYMFRHIIHDWTDEQSTVILKHCRKAMPANGRLLLVETVVPQGNERAPGKDFDFTMLMYPGGKERTEEEYRTLFQGAGFKLHGITPTASPVSVIEARPV